MKEMVVVGALWGGWCVLHSLLAGEGVVGWFEGKVGRRFYRLSYNVFSVVTLVPVVLYNRGARGEVMWGWDGGWQVVRWGMVVFGVVFFWLGVRRYDMGQFLGWRQDRGAGIGAGGGVEMDGVLGWTRHPWYTAGLVLVWARPLSGVDMVANGVICLYLVVGAYLEERKLLRRHGEEYARYRRRVSMLVPWPRRGE